MDEYIDVLRELWAPADDAEKSTVDGRFVTFEDCIMRPRPTNGTVPFVIGGHSPHRRPPGRPPRRRVLPRRRDAWRSSPSCSPSCAPRPRPPGATRTPSSCSAAAGGPGPKLDARIEQLAEIGVTHIVVGAAPPDELPGIGADLVAKFG